jgi:hypothetical protein
MTYIVEYQVPRARHAQPGGLLERLQPEDAIDARPHHIRGTCDFEPSEGLGCVEQVCRHFTTRRASASALSPSAPTRAPCAALSRSAERRIRKERAANGSNQRVQRQEHAGAQPAAAFEISLRFPHACGRQRANAVGAATARQLERNPPIHGLPAEEHAL